MLIQLYEYLRTLLLHTYLGFVLALGLTLRTSLRNQQLLSIALSTRFPPWCLLGFQPCNYSLALLHDCSNAFQVRFGCWHGVLPSSLRLCGSLSTSTQQYGLSPPRPSRRRR